MALTPSDEGLKPRSTLARGGVREPGIARDAPGDLGPGDLRAPGGPVRVLPLKEQLLALAVDRAAVAVLEEGRQQVDDLDAGALEGRRRTS